jgi:NADPH:quinone reductase-like Zn-dependent oxidoreductase
MKAWFAVRTGQPKDVLELKTDLPTPPTPKSGQIMVRVTYAALNPGDLKMMAHKLPFKGAIIPAMDLVGEVVEIGSSTSSALRVGMTVAGTTSMMNVWRGIGILANYVVLPAHVLVEKPGALDEPSAVGLLGVAGQTSYVLTRTASLRKGNRALVNGASGGVGCILIQAL